MTDTSVKYINSDPIFTNTIITDNESWVYKSQSSKWEHSTSPRPKKARQVRSKVKMMLTAFFASPGVVHHKYASQGHTITKTGMSSIASCCARDRSCGQQEIGATITTMLQHIPRTWSKLFWRTNKFLALLTWLTATSGCSPNSRGHWKERDFRQESILWLQR